jgi:hypothetical protein
MNARGHSQRGLVLNNQSPLQFPLMYVFNGGR